ncbi:glycosyltransferase family 4 protein [Candidatus Babeliales bacterium]|nr:glycosyltransferase family 4 protein [Candidatus Babeliales bacterium]
MKILVISHTYITQINRDKWKIFAQDYPNMSLTVVFPRSWPGSLYHHHAENLEKEQLKNCKFVALKAFGTGNEVRYGYYPSGLVTIMRTFKPDIIHVEQGDNALSLFQSIIFAKLFCRKAKLSFFTWVNWHHKFSLKYRMFWGWIEKFNRFFTHGAIAGNQDAKQLLAEKGFTKTTTVCPQLGINLKTFKPAHVEHHRHRYIGYIGRIVEEKGVMLLAQAFHSLHTLFPDWRLIFIGTGPFEKQLIDYVITHKLIDVVEFRDPITHDKVPNALSFIDILVLPSYDTNRWKEQFGHVLIEAMACKVPVLASSAGEIPNVVAQAGLIFEQRNEQSLTTYLHTLMSDAHLRNQLGEKGYQRVKNHYSHQAIAKATHDFWQSL